MRPRTSVMRELHCGHVAASFRYGPATGFTSSWIGLYLRAIGYLQLLSPCLRSHCQKHPITKRDSAAIAIIAAWPNCCRLDGPSRVHFGGAFDPAPAGGGATSAPRRRASHSASLWG